MFDIQSLDSLLDRGISGNHVHTVVVSDPNGATLTFVDTIDTASEAQNRRVRIVAALGIDAWRESVTNNIARDALSASIKLDDDSAGTAMGRVECEVRSRHRQICVSTLTYSYSVGTRRYASRTWSNSAGARPGSLSNPQRKRRCPLVDTTGEGKERFLSEAQRLRMGPFDRLLHQGCALVEHLSTSIASIGDDLKSGQTPPMMKYSQPRAR